MAKKTMKRKTKPASAGKKTTPKAEKGYPVPLQSVLDFAEMLKKAGHLDRYLSEEKEARAALRMDAKSIAFVTKYLDDHELHPKAAEALPIKPAAATAMRSSQINICPCIKR
jgi:hypothetical protein